MITEFIYVRHGETEANRNAVLQGGGVDMPLNETGIRQAQAAAEYLSKEHFDVAFASELIRAAETARIIAQGNEYGFPLELVPQLREWNCGELDGMSFKEIRERFPKEGMSFAFEQIETQMPGGELGWDFQARVAGFLTETAKKYAGKRILLVSHGGVLQRIFRMIAGIVQPGNMLPLAGNASVSSFIYNDELQVWQLTSWNRNDHLKGIPQHALRVV